MSFYVSLKSSSGASWFSGKRIVLLAQRRGGGQPDLPAGGRHGTPRCIELSHLPARPIGGRPHRDGADAIAERMPSHVGEHHALEMGGGLLSEVHRSTC